MSDFGRRGTANSRSSANAGGGRLSSRSKLTGATAGRFLGIFALFVFGYLGAATVTSLLAQRGATQARSKPVVDDAYIQRRLQVCIPTEPPGNPWEFLRRTDQVLGTGWTVKEGDPDSWLPVAAVPNFLKCAAETERKRFCVQSYRVQYASQLTRYYRYLTRVGATTPLAGMAFRIQAAEAGQANSNAGHEDIATGQENIVTHNPVILNAVRDLSRDGLLSVRDFGWLGPPKPLEPLLEKEPRASDRTCL